jgi:hypothetical protein
VLTSNQIRQYYYQGFKEEPVHRQWRWLWNKHFKIRAQDGNFYKLNKLRPRLNFQVLKRLCIHYTPRSVYMSVLNYLMPERVGRKKYLKWAYPFSGSYCIDIDSHVLRRKHNHKLDARYICVNCIQVSKEATLAITDKISENYSDIEIIFSGCRGFHIWVRDFNPTDWVQHKGDMPKTFESSRYVYSLKLKKTVEGFDSHHFILSCDITRVPSFPNSLNSRTGLKCLAIGAPSDLESLEPSKIIQEADASMTCIKRASWLQAHSP